MSIEIERPVEVTKPNGHQDPAASGRPAPARQIPRAFLIAPFAGAAAFTLAASIARRRAVRAAAAQGSVRILSSNRIVFHPVMAPRFGSLRVGTRRRGLFRR